MMESRKTIFRSFFAGIFITGGIYKAYTAYDKSTKKHEWLSFAQEMMKARLSFLESGEQPLRHNRAEAIPFIPAQRFNNHNSTTLGGGGFGKIPPASMMSPFHLGDILHPLPLPPSLGLLGSDKELKMLTPELVEIRLGQNQKSVKLQNPDPQHRPGRARSNLVQGYSINQLASNNPIEDDLSTHVVRNHEGAIEKLFFGVFDGHSGWCCSQKVAQELAPSVAKELDQLRSLKDKAQVSKAIERGFLKLDQRIVQDSVQRVLEHGTRPLACSSLLPAISGSCAILAYVDERERDLYVACTGDSRAVMGVREPLPEGGGHVWRAVPLSADQTGRSKSEIKRMQLEHPGEEKTVVSRGRVLGGLEPTRSFGDARYKWTKEIQDKVFSLFPAYREPRPNYNTPPYVTAKPVVRHHKIQSEDRFMVMATDGLWDKLTSDEVVQLVGSLLDGKTGQEEMVLDREEIHRYRQKRRAILAASTPQSSAQKQVQQMDDEDEDEVTPANLAPKGPASQARRFTYRDQANVATHLIRNAIGGADDDKVAATLSIPSPISRSYRDDITVTVLFFEEQGTTLALSSAQAADKDLVEIL
ncbi:hypothetical protein BGZ83_008506 [Gryganskiella cystojenkinii]|nr:hypothetical protein BGZ83_008506 [Gryganskiella cystojenkinii]